MSLKLFLVFLLGVAIHLSTVSGQDDRRISLDVLERILRAQLANRPGPVRPRSPYRTRRFCSPRRTFRTINGICNNLQNSVLGAAKTPEPRMIPTNRYDDGANSVAVNLFSTGTALPSARLVSRTVHLTNSNVSTIHSHLLMTWGQFVDHDVIQTPAREGTFNEGGNGIPEQCCLPNHAEFTEFGECFPIFIPPGDSFARTCIPFLRSTPTPGLPNTPVIRYQINDVTSFVDGSQVYGISRRQARELRTLRDGLFKTTPGVGGQVGLPPNPSNTATCSRQERCRFLAGDNRVDEQAGLAGTHTLFVREHNRIAKALKSVNANWSDNRLYQNARKIVGAILQRITYGEFLPEILGDTIMRKYRLNLLESGRFRGYSSSTDPGTTTEFGTAAFRFGHSMIRQTFTTSTTQTRDISVMFNVFSSVNQFGDDGILNGMLVDKIETLDKFLVDGVRDRLFNEELDLPALNIQRGRDHGIGSYNDVRRFFSLRVFTDYDQMVGVTHSQANVNALRAVYPTPEDIEMFPGGLSELALPDAVMGETFANMLGLQFQKLKVGDRFWHETNDRFIRFTDAQLAEIRKTSMADVYCRNVEGVVARSKLFLSESTSNPRVDCSAIPTINFNAWRRTRREQEADRGADQLSAGVTNAQFGARAVDGVAGLDRVAGAAGAAGGAAADNDAIYDYTYAENL